MTIQTKLLNMYLFIYSKTTLPVITLFFYHHYVTSACVAFGITKSDSLGRLYI